MANKNNPITVNWVYRTFFVTVVMLLALASAGCAEPPPGGEPSWSNIFSGSAPEETQDEQDFDPGYLTPATPYPTVTSGVAGPTLSRPPEITPTPDPYVTIYNRTTQFNLSHSVEAFSFDLTAPPLIIDFEVEPKMITREKHGTSDYGKKSEGVFKQTYPSEDSWFEVTVRDRESGKIVAQDGFGNRYSADIRKRIFVGQFGNYLIQFSGNDVKVHTVMRAGGV